AGVRGEAPARPRWWRGTGCAGRRHPRCRSPPPGGGTERGGGRDRAPDRRPTAGQPVGRWLCARRDRSRADAPRAGRAGVRRYLRHQDVGGKPVRILFAGDCHGATDHVKALINEAGKRECDRIFVLGDFGYWEHMADGVKFLDKVSAFAIKRGISVYFLDGNHDKTSLLLEKYADEPNDEGFLTVRGRLFYAPRGHQWTWDGVSFIALGGAYSVDKQWRLDQERKGKRKGGTLWFPEEEMTDEDMLNILGTVSRVDVMLAHDKPFDSKPKWNRKTFEECAPNQLRLQWAVDALKPSM